MRTEEKTDPVPEGSHAPFKITFRNTSRVLSSPISIIWDLTALDGTVIAYQQTVAEVSSVSYITLTPDQTRILYGESGKGERLLTLHITYLSSLGTDMMIRKQIKFTIQDLQLVGYPLSIDVTDTIFTDDYVRDLVIA